MATDSAAEHQGMTETERGVASLWNEVLMQSGPIQPTDNFFALGGDSLAMTMMLYRVQEEFSVELPPAALLETLQLRPFCALLDTLRAGVQRSERSLS